MHDTEHSLFGGGCVRSELLDKCDCNCHKDGGVHNMPCCQSCFVCRRQRIPIWKFEQHVAAHNRIHQLKDSIREELNCDQ